MLNFLNEFRYTLLTIHLNDGEPPETGLWIAKATSVYKVLHGLSLGLGV